MGVQIVALFLLLEFLTVALLWSLDPLAVGVQTSFALYLAVVLILFAMISYVYRSLKSSDRIGRLPILAGCCFIATLLLLGFVY